MPSGTDAPDDYWTPGSGTGTSATWSFQGVDGLQRLSGPGVIEVPDPAAFSARLTRIQLDHVALERFEAGPHRFRRAPEDIDREPTPLLMLMLLEQGRMRIDLPDGSFDLQAGECALVDSRAPITITTTTATRVLRSVVGLEHVPTALRRRSTGIPAPLRATLLTDSFTAFVRSVLATTADGQRARGTHVVQAIADLQTAVLAEAQQLTDRPTGPAGLRSRIEQLIEERYDDPRLDATSIAASLHISVRHAHAVFDDGDLTIARAIRDTRVGAAARELRVGDAPLRFTDVARRHGFGSQDTLARAFRARFGMTLTDYRRGGHRSFG